MIPFKSTLKILLFLFFFVPLAGCINLSNKKIIPASTYTMTAINPDVVHAKPTRQVLLVSIPKAMSGYDSSDMIYTDKTFQLKSFADHHWIDTPANLLLPVIIQSLRNTHQFRAVVPPSSISVVDWRLDTELVVLQQEFLHKPSQVKLVLNAQLVNAITQKVIKSEQFSVVEPAPTDNPYGGVMATNQAVEKILGKLAVFCVSRNPAL